MSLRDHQVIFAKNFGLLIGYIYAQGYEITLGEAHRTALQAWANGLPKGTKITAETPSGVRIEWTEKVGGIGSAKSLHKIRLAMDINLFSKEGAYLTEETHFMKFADYWKSLNPLNRAGLDFGDAGHFSMEHMGVK